MTRAVDGQTAKASAGRTREVSPSERAGIGAPGVDGTEEPPYFAGYPSAMSYAAGDLVRVHVATRASANCFVDIYRVVGRVPGTFTPRLAHVLRTDSIEPSRYPKRKDRVPLGPGDADTNGCGWPSVDLLRVPSEWQSGVYLLQFTSSPVPTGKASERLGEEALFIVRPASPGAGSRILLQVGIATWSAYHVWRNCNLYVGVDGNGVGREELRSGRVSFLRPGVGLGCLNDIVWWPGKARQYLLPFLEWIENMRIPIEYCTGLDLDSGAVALDRYLLVLTIGHDEYWTSAQRDAVERFIDKGGNAAFLGGNLAYWQIRAAGNGTSIECHKRSDQFRGEPLDPRFRGLNNSPRANNRDVTVQFDSPPVNRPTTSFTGVSWHNSGDSGGFTGADVDFRFAGAMWWWEQSGGPERPAKGFTVCNSEHWVFDGAGLRNGDTFGEEQKLVGYECDGLDVSWLDGIPAPSPDSGTPPNLEIMAFADCTDWADFDYRSLPPTKWTGPRLNDGALGGVVTMVSWRTRGGGVVFTAPTTDWTHGLVPTVDYTRYKCLEPHINPPSVAVQRITENVLKRLGGWADED